METTLNKLISSYNNINAKIEEAKKNDNESLFEEEQTKKLEVAKKIVYVHEICPSIYEHLKNNFWVSKTPLLPNANKVLECMSDLIKNNKKNNFKYVKITYNSNKNEAKISNFKIELTENHDLKDCTSCFPIALIDHIINELKPIDGITLMKSKKVVRNNIYVQKKHKKPNGVYDVLSMHCTYLTKDGKVIKRYFDIVEDPNTKLYLTDIISYEINCK